MSTASSAKRCSISARIASVQGSAPKIPIRSEAGARIEPLAGELVADRQHVGRRHHDDVGLEVGDQLDLALGHAARHRHHGAPQPLGAVMRAQAAGEQAIAVDHVDQVARPAARGADRARADLGPDLDVGLGVADHGRLAGRARRGMDPRHLRARHGEHAERVVAPQVVLGGEREAARDRRAP